MPLWPTAYFKFKLFENQPVQNEQFDPLLLPPPKAANKFPKGMVPFLYQEVERSLLFETGN